MLDPNLPKAILFDLDDTIITGDVSTEELWKTLCYQHAEYIEGLSGDVLFSEVNNRVTYDIPTQKKLASPAPQILLAKIRTHILRVEKHRTAPIIANILPIMSGVFGPTLSDNTPIGNSLNIRRIKYPDTAIPTRGNGAVNSSLIKGA